MKSRDVTFLNNLDGFLGKRTRTMIECKIDNKTVHTSK